MVKDRDQAENDVGVVVVVAVDDLSVLQSNKYGELCLHRFVP